MGESNHCIVTKNRGGITLNRTAGSNLYSSITSAIGSGQAKQKLCLRS